MHVVAKDLSDMTNSAVFCVGENPEWLFLHYDDEEMYRFVKEEFPELYDMFVRLRRVVEQTDVFRYLVLFR